MNEAAGVNDYHLCFVFIVRYFIAAAKQLTEHAFRIDLVLIASQRDEKKFSHVILMLFPLLLHAPAREHLLYPLPQKDAKYRYPYCWKRS